jgi:hypothetical protein
MFQFGPIGRFLNLFCLNSIRCSLQFTWMHYFMFHHSGQFIFPLWCITLTVCFFVGQIFHWSQLIGRICICFSPDFFYWILITSEFIDVLAVVHTIHWILQLKS